MQKEPISRNTFLKGIAAGAVVACSLGSLTLTEYSTVNRGGNYDFVPGTYSATAKGMESDVKVTITVDDSSITDVAVDVSGETQGIGAAIGDTVCQQILEMQSSAIDGVSGATVSSQAVRDALDAAIAKAEAGEADAETEAADDTAGIEAATEAAEAEADSAAGEASTEAEAAENGESADTGAAAAAGSYTDGTYTASAAGIQSDVTGRSHV